MLSSSDSIKPFENMLAGLLRDEPLTKENALEYIRLGKQISDTGLILKSLAEAKIKENLVLME